MNLKTEKEYKKNVVILQTCQKKVPHLYSIDIFNQSKGIINYVCKKEKYFTEKFY